MLHNYFLTSPLQLIVGKYFKYDAKRSNKFKILARSILFHGPSFMQKDIMHIKVTVRKSC